MLKRAIIYGGFTFFLMALTPLPGPFSSSASGPGIQFAEYQDDLDTYPHRIMGGIREKDSLYVLTENAQPFKLSLSASNPGHVFEDVKPIIGDVDGDGRNDVAVIETSLTKGASLAVYSLRNNNLVKIAQTDFIGRKNRWFAQMGIGDYNKDGRPDIAFVDRPHLARTLRIFTYRNGSLEQIAAGRGVTNHAIGDETIWGGTRTCKGRDELVLKSLSSGTFVALWINPTTQTLTARDLKIRATPNTFSQAITC